MDTVHESPKPVTRESQIAPHEGAAADDTPPPFSLASHNLPHFVLVGGFLGAGKTTFLKAYANWLADKGLRVGMISNDQSEGLVDSKRFGFVTNAATPSPNVAEIPGGCFCCKSDLLVTEIQKMLHAYKPNMILAEPVGSCTDLVATVLRPMNEVYKMPVTYAPFAVLVDAGNWERKKFANSVEYISSKQLEEAEVILLGQIDRISKTRLGRVKQSIRELYPQKTILEFSTLSGEGLDKIFDILSKNQSLNLPNIDVDYDTYSVGEALLGWYNAEVSLHAVKDSFDGNKLLLILITALKKLLSAEGLEIAHVKFSLTSSLDSEVAAAGLGVVQLTGNASKISVVDKMKLGILIGELIINVRAQGQASTLRSIVGSLLNRKDVTEHARAIWKTQNAFQPGRPKPIWRIH